MKWFSDLGDKKYGIIAVVALLILSGLIEFYRDFIMEKTPGVELTDLSDLYEAKEERDAAHKRLEEGNVEAAQVVTAKLDGVPIVAIVFDGLPERSLTARLLDVLAKHEAKATFFVEGQNAEEQVETMTLLQNSGQTVGNYSYVGLEELEKESAETVVEQVCRAQKVITVRTALAPDYFRSPRVSYTDDFLKIVNACGVPYAVKENVRYQRGTLMDDGAAKAYADSIAPGSIIAIPVSRSVRRPPKAAVVTDEKPAVDMQPTIKDDTPAAAKPTVDLATELGCLRPWRPGS